MEMHTVEPLHMQTKFLGAINVYFDVIDQLLITYSVFDTYRRKGESILEQNISYRFRESP